MKTFTRVLAGAAVLPFFVLTLHAQFDPGNSTNYYYGAPIGSWSFVDTNAWTNDFGISPASFSNISASLLGHGTALVVDSSDPAWLQYNVRESSGTNNLKVDVGSVFFWFAPNWSGTNMGGRGPGEWGRLLELGCASTNGIWSLFTDPDGVNLYFMVGTNGGPKVTYFSVPVEWETNRWHCIALTYTPTNTVLYLDGWYATNAPGITNFPGPEALTNGLFIGSDRSGGSQAHGMFDDFVTYDYPVDGRIVSSAELTGELYFYLNPLNRANWLSSPLPSNDNTPVYNAITGAGFLQYLGSSGSCFTSSNLWMTNLSATAASNPMTFGFSIAGGTNGYLYDVFAEPALVSPVTNGMWSWQGQGQSCANYSIAHLPTGGAVFFILGGPQDSDGDGLTDAYEGLVSHTDPNKPDTSGDGILDGWKVQWALNLFLNNPNQTSLRANYGYDLAPWLNTISGVRNGTVTTDAEGNVLSVSQ